MAENIELEKNKFTETLANSVNTLLKERNSNGVWDGMLSSSALSTGISVLAMSLLADESLSATISISLDWLGRNINDDGGWGDTPQCPSNLSTTLIVWSAIGLASDNTDDNTDARRSGEGWLVRHIGSLRADAIAESLAKKYGGDKTFSVPIMSAVALSRRLDNDDGDDNVWKHIPELPFELALLGHRFLKWLSLPVVSYALPALIAMGMLRFNKLPPKCPVKRTLKSLAIKPVLRKLAKTQPLSGGFLEAAPLTSFVVMSLAAIGLGKSDVAKRGVKFLLDTARLDGSWPIDTNLSTWVTTLAVNALPNNADIDRNEISRWLANQQHRLVHPYTQASPGGWAWTNLSGGVPDADDTAGALLAIKKLSQTNPAKTQASNIEPSGVQDAIRWLLDMQNNDGGIPTFCKGWGKLEFDRSSPDITAHAISALIAWAANLPSDLARRSAVAIDRAISYLIKNRQADGTWLALWFGNQHHANQANPVYGTARVIRALADLVHHGTPRAGAILTPAIDALAAFQLADGSFASCRDTTASIEETAVAVEALAAVCKLPRFKTVAIDQTLSGGRWLIERTERGRHFPASPIGLYFANLWYSEKLYPVIFTTAALARVVEI